MHNTLVEINYLLILASAIIALIYLSERDKIAVYVFCLLCASFGLLERYIPDSLGTLCYLAAATTDLLIIHILSKINKPTKLILKIQDLCLYFIGANFIGWLAFMSYLEPIYYTALCTLLYLRMLIIIGGNSDSIRSFAMDSGMPSISSDNHSFNYNEKQNKKEIRN